VNRQIPTADKATEKLLRDILDQLDKLNRGASFAGRVSFGDVIQIGNITITTSGDTVKFQNVQDGKSTTLTLT